MKPMEPAFGRVFFIMKKERILIRLRTLENQVEFVSEKMYNPSIESSEFRELNKKKKKLKKTIDKLKKKVYNDNQ